MESKILTLVLSISGLMIGLLAAGIVASLITAFIWHLFPYCAYSKWVKAEVFQEEDLTFKSEQQDWIAKRMNK